MSSTLLDMVQRPPMLFCTVSTHGGTCFTEHKLHTIVSIQINYLALKLSTVEPCLSDPCLSVPSIIRNDLWKFLNQLSNA